MNPTSVEIDMCDSTQMDDVSTSHGNTSKYVDTVIRSSASVNR